MIKMMIACAALALAAPAVAGAATANATAQGRVTLQQMQAGRLARTMKLDTNHDGRITRAEYSARMMRHFQAKGMDAAHARAKIDRLFAKTDLNHDGVLSPDEINRMTARRFARMDPGHTGYVTASNLRHRRDPAPVAVSR